MESTIGQEKQRLWTTSYEICCTASLKTESEIMMLIASFETWCLPVSHNIYSKFCL